MNANFLEMCALDMAPPVPFVASICYLSPFDDKGLAKALTQSGYSGPVVFDLILSTGNRRDRFLEVEFCDGRFAWRDVLVSLRPENAERARVFYATHHERCDMAIVSKPLRFHLRRGDPLPTPAS